ncbi:MAG: serine hydrolase [Longimicrobiales bacterium]
MSIPERMAYHGIPAMSMAVIDSGRIAWARAYGVREQPGNSRVDPHTLFQAASLSKPATALGALLLVQQHRLVLDDDVRPFTRSWRPTEAITLRQLLSHTAGLTVSGFSGYTRGVPLPNPSQILNGERPANSDAVRVATSPGKQVTYSGGGYVVVQQLIAELTKRRFDEYMQTDVLAPLGMAESSFEQPLPAEHLRRTASGHRRDGALIAGGSMVHPELAAAGLWTTPRDLAHLLIELQDALAGRPTRLLKVEAAREMLTGRAENVGLGVFLTGPNGSSRRFVHSGRNAGFDAYLVGYKNGRQGAVVMINRNNNEGFINEVLESVAREYGWPDYIPDAVQGEYDEVPSAIQATYAGAYEATDHATLSVVFENGKLFARSGEDAWFRLYPASETQFFATVDSVRWTFVKNDDGTTKEVVARSADLEVRRRRVR